MRITKITPVSNNLAKVTDRQINYIDGVNVSFSGLSASPKSKYFEPIRRFIAPIKKAYHEKIEIPIENGFLRMIQSKPFEKVVDGIYNSQQNKMQKIEAFNAANKDKNKLKKFDSMLFSHLIVIGSTILSGFYVIKTINNKKLDEKKRRTLSINQAAVWLASTVMAYTVDGKLSKMTDKVKKDFIKLEKQSAKNNPLLDKHVEGIGKAKTIMVIDTIYRFLAPVAMTPIANYIGNKIQESEKAQIASSKL